MTLDEWVALPEDNTYRYELQEGVLLVSPRAARRHRLAAQRLSQQLDGQLPADWESVLDMEMVVRAEYPPIVRVPDMVVTRVVDPRTDWRRRTCCLRSRSSHRDRATLTCTSSRASTRRREFRITGSSTLIRPPRRSRCATWVYQRSDTSMPQRSPVSSLRPCRSVCVSISPLWSPRVPRGIGNQQWSSEWCAWFLDPGFRSWARFDYQPGSRRWPVHQFGPRRLFNEVAAAYHQWEHAGRPPVTQWRFTLTPEGQRVELTGTTQTSRGA